MTNAKIISSDVVLGVNDDVPIIACPFCNSPTITFDEEGFGDYTPCEHMQFLYDSDSEQFEYESEQFHGIIKKLNKTVMKSCKLAKATDLRRFADEVVKFGENVTIIAESYSGEDCGPDKTTTVAAFDNKGGQTPSELYF
ncbi:MAG: hypothetical protein ACRC37_03480 [Lentisphaeria bacterium]